MTQEQQQLLIIKGVIADLDKFQQEKIYNFRNELAEKIEKDPILGMAIALYGAELAAL